MIAAGARPPNQLFGLPLVGRRDYARPAVFVDLAAYWRRRWILLLIAVIGSVLFGVIVALERRAAVAIDVLGFAGLMILADYLTLGAADRLPAFRRLTSRLRQLAVALALLMLAFFATWPYGPSLLVIGAIVLLSTVAEIAYLKRGERKRAGGRA
jgi:hypothetical protein